MHKNMKKILCWPKSKNRVLEEFPIVKWYCISKIMTPKSGTKFAQIPKKKLLGPFSHI